MISVDFTSSKLLTGCFVKKQLNNDPTRLIVTGIFACLAASFKPSASVADFAGIGASVAGTMGVAGGKPALGLDFAVAIRDAARAARFAGAALPLKPAQLGKLAGNGRIDATLEGVRVKADVTAIGAKTTVNGTVGNMLLDPNLKENDVIELKRSINKLKKTCDAIQGDIAGIGEDWVVVAPSFVEVYRDQKSELPQTYTEE